jgi:hypothetical protein
LNTSNNEGSSIYLDNNRFDIYNSVFWGDTDPYQIDVTNINDVIINLYYCAYTNGKINLGTSDPYPVNDNPVTLTGSPFVSTTTSSPNFLYPGDAIVDQGLKAYIPELYKYDLAGYDRKAGVNTKVDIGCYEMQ